MPDDNDKDDLPKPQSTDGKKEKLGDNDKDDLPAPESTESKQKELLQTIAEPIRAQLESLPAEERAQLIQYSMSFSSGPFPPAEEGQAWERVLPGSANRMFVFAENEQGERANQNKRKHREEMSMTFGGILVLLVFYGLVGFALYLGQPLVAVPLATLPWVYGLLRKILGRRKNGRGESSSD